MLRASKLLQKHEKKKAAMADALSELKTGTLSYGAVSRNHKIPKTTLYRHAQNDDLKSQGRQPVFSAEFEEELAQHVKSFDELLFGLDRRDVQKLAYQMAVRNKIPHRFSNVTKMAGKKWMTGFFSRPAGAQLALRQPECLSLNRFKCFSRESCDKFFDLLIQLVEEHGFTASSIYNMDESGFSTVQKKNVKVIAAKGKKRVSVLASGERGRNITVVCCTNAAGDWHVKPFIIFKGSRITQEHAIGLIEGRISIKMIFGSLLITVFLYSGGRINGSPSGWIDSELFVVWLNFFISTVHPTPERKVLLILDGHTSHTKNLKAINLARKHGVIMLQLPAHCTHRLQPLDVSFFKPLSDAYIAEIRRWMNNNKLRAVTNYQFAGIFSEAYKQVTTYANAANGFSASGIWPINKDIFLETDFAKKALRSPPRSVQLAVPLEELMPLPIVPDFQLKPESHAVVLTSPIYISGLEEKLRIKAEKEQKQKERLEIRDKKRKEVEERKIARAAELERKKVERESKKKEQEAVKAGKYIFFVQKSTHI
jgi:DDE superfamily endonuclease